MDAIIMEEVIRRRRIAIVTLVMIEMLRKKRRKQSKRKLWSREWLMRRNKSDSTLTMLFNELGPEDPASFPNFTRMEENIFDELLCLLIPLIAKKNTVMREAISPKDRLSVTLRYLATGNTFEDLQYSTRIAANTISQIVSSVIDAIITVLEDKVISFPSTVEEWTLIADKYRLIWQFPHCIGAMDGKHIAFRPLKKDGSMYHNYKGSDSIILLGLVDAEYKFIFVNVGRNGRMHDSAVFKESLLGVKLESNSLNLPSPSHLPGFAYDMPYVIIGDDAFPLKTNLLKPYPDRQASTEMRVFNYKLSRARRTSENAFGILVNRFRVLLETIPLSVDKVENITYACVLLHNYLISKNCQWYTPRECRIENAEKLPCNLTRIAQQGSNRCTDAAIEVRNKYCDYFNTVGAVHWQYDAIANGNM